LPGFNPAFAEASMATFASGFYIWEHVDCHPGTLSELCHVCVTDVWKKLTCIKL